MKKKTPVKQRFMPTKQRRWIINRAIKLIKELFKNKVDDSGICIVCGKRVAKDHICKRNPKSSVVFENCKMIRDKKNNC